MSINPNLHPFNTATVAQKPPHFSYTALAINEVQPSTSPAYLPQPIIAPPTQVAILKTVNNEPKQNAQKKRAFQLPSLAWVVLEVAGLGLLGFVGNYLGRLQYCESTKKILSSGIKTFDSITAHHQAVEKALGAFDKGIVYPTQVEGSWAGHANQLVTLIKEYYHNPASFTGVKLLSNTPESIRQQLYGYTQTALSYYQEAGNVNKQVEIAHLIYKHKLSIPKQAYNDKTVALRTFKEGKGKPLDFLSENTNLETIRTTFPSLQLPSTQSDKNWKAAFCTWADTLLKTKDTTYQTRTLELINRYSALMESFHIIQSISTNKNEDKTAQRMEDFWRNHLDDFKLFNQQGDPIELLLALKSTQAVFNQYGEKEKAWQVGIALQKLSEAIEKSIKKAKPLDCTGVLGDFTTFITADLSTEAKGEAQPLPLALHKWIRSQVGQLGVGKPEEPQLAKDLLNCIQPINNTNTPNNNRTRLTTFYKKLKEERPQSITLFLLKRWIELFNATIEGTTLSPNFGEGSFPRDEYRYNPVGRLLSRIDEFITKNQSPTS